MNQLRTYYLADKESAIAYFTTHWTRHLTSLPKFGFTVEGVWLGQSPENENQVIAVVSFPDGEDVGALTRAYMSSADFQADMAGFDMSKIQKVDSLLMKPSPNFK